jgi:hypothetical protein
LVTRVCFYLPSLPGSDADLFSLCQVAGTPDLQVRYRTASQKIGLQIASATEQLSDATVSASTWIGVDIRYDVSGTTYTADWSVDYGAGPVEQAQATRGSVAPSLVGNLILGWTGSATQTVRYDDIAASRIRGQYPLGDIRIYPLGVDPAGSVTISGTTGNFQTMSANGTLAAWNATTARGAIDDIPPTISASADGIVQSTTAASDYVEIPMQTRDAAANAEAIRAVKWYFPMWAASGTANSIGLRGYDGTTETTLFSTADPGADNSTTTPVWICKMHRTLGSALHRTWTQTQLDALTARVGFSGDASPAVGVHAVIAEVAMRAGESRTLFGGLASIAADPDPNSVIDIEVDATTLSDDADLVYEVNASPTTVPVTQGTTHTETVGATVAGEVNYIALVLPPEPDPVD